MTSNRRPVIVYVVRSFPRLSQTFVLDEMLRLEHLGARIELFTLEASGETLVQPDVARLRATPAVLPVASFAQHVLVALAAPRRYLTAALAAARQVQHEQGYHAESRFRAFGRAVTLARRLHRLGRTGPVHVHAHFAHDPALVAQIAHLLTGVTYTFTAHARDVHQVSPVVMGERGARAEAVVACCAANAAVLETVVPGKVRHLPHGVDTDYFRPAAPTPSLVRAKACPPLVVSVGRLVEKKGLADLLAALARLREQGVPFRAEVHGDGPLRGELTRLAVQLGLGDHVTFMGARTRDQLRETYQAADVFALTPYAIADGDVDGIPNVVLEAMACGLPVVATAAGGVGEAITPGHHGLLAGPRDVAAVARHLAALLADAGLRRTMGEAARRTAVERFDGWSASRQLLDLFRQSLGTATREAPGDDDGHVPIEAAERRLGAGAGPAGRPA
ncbi:MAG: glycosyltransferase [Actinomycetota bacterium]|nr:glycosyltransferase [Actinomycetota bacterium]